MRKSCVYSRTNIKLPDFRVLWACECGYQHCIMEGYELENTTNCTGEQNFSYRTDQLKLPEGTCNGCKKEIETIEWYQRELSKVMVEKDELFEESDKKIKELQRKLDNANNLIMSAAPLAWAHAPNLDEDAHAWEIKAEKYLKGSDVL